ncbi:MAG TPA: ABC transporter permease [Thermoanaerobaculia bacterium]|nr:ABC transporter permease [Thermoanaerobaculia bacterium]
MQDLRFAFRQMAVKPLLSVLAVVSLALGVGVNSSIFSIVNAVLLRGVPATDPDRLVAVYTSGSEGLRYAPSSYPDYRDLREQSDVLSGLGSHSAFIAAFESKGRTQPLFGEVVTGNFFDLLGVRPALGRSFLPEEDRTPGAHPVVMLGYGFWQKQFGGDRSVLGQSIALNGTQLTVVGVTPAILPSTIPGLRADFWLPIQMNDALSEDKALDARGRRSFFLVGRLRPGVSLAQAQAQLGAVGAQLAAQYPETNKDRKITLVPWRKVTFNPAVDGALVGAAGMLMALVAMVLLIASSNIANLLLARANDRRQEITLRLAMGASRGRLIRQLVTESLLLALLSGALGLLIALAATRLLVNFNPPLPVPVSLDLGLDGRVLLFTLALALATGVICGLAPALQASRPDLVTTLKDGAATLGRNYRKLGLRNLLVVAQVAVSTVLLIGAALFLRSLAHAQSVDPGFNLRRGAVVDFNLGLGRKYGPAEGRNFLRQVVERVRALPGVRGAAVTGHLPLGISIVSEKVQVEGQPPRDDKQPEIDLVAVSPGYFETLGIPLVEGRAFNEHDDPTAGNVAIVNATAAHLFWPGASPLGKRLKIGKDGAWTEVVGVAHDGKYRSLGEEPRPFLYRSYLQDYSPAMTLVVATDVDEPQTLRAVRRELEAMDSTLPVFDSKTMSQHLGIMLFPARMGAWLLAAFGLLGLLLAAVGLYGVVSYSVSKRTREVGVRMAIGAHRGQILQLVLREGMVLVGIGLAVGIGCALAGSRLLTSLLYGIGANDPLVFLGVPVALIAVALLATVIPARRAMRVDPMAALRYE